VNIPLNLSLDVLTYLTDSDETLEVKAQGQVDTVLRKVGEAMGEKAWQGLVRKSQSPEGSRLAFIRQSGTDMVKSATPAQRAKAEKIAFTQLKARRDELGGK